MRFFDESTDFDAAESNERSVRANQVLQEIRLGLITPENMDVEQRQVVREYFRHMPLVYRDEQTGLTEVTGEQDWREGQDWCFATSAEGVFGVFSLRWPLHSMVRGATFHLWPGDFSYDPALDHQGREDFSDLHLYQDAALEYALAAAA
jgi:hypothetical protein